MLAATLACVAAPNPVLRAQISPAGRASIEGDSSSSYPLGRFDARIQQLHADLTPGGSRTLIGHAYRRDAISTRDALTGFTVELEVTASTAPHLPAAAQSSFAANLGRDATLVLPRGPVSFPATGRPGRAPAPSFEYRIPWQTPFTLAGSATLCLDLTIHGNTTSAGNDRNFSLLLDAQDWRSDGATTQPGYRFGTGCAATGSSTAHSARVEMPRRADGSLELTIDSRDGVPDGGNGIPRLGLVVGLATAPTAWPWKPGCQMLPSLDASFDLPGGNDAAGDWNGSITNLPMLPSGQEFVLQLVSGIPSSGSDLTFSDGTLLTVPPLLPPVQPAARIASGSDRNSTSGTVSSTVTITEFF